MKSLSEREWKRVFKEVRKLPDDDPGKIASAKIWSLTRGFYTNTKNRVNDNFVATIYVYAIKPLIESLENKKLEDE